MLPLPLPPLWQQSQSPHEHQWRSKRRNSSLEPTKRRIEIMWSMELNLECKCNHCVTLNCVVVWSDRPTDWRTTVNIVSLVNLLWQLVARKYHYFEPNSPILPYLSVVRIWHIKLPSCFNDLRDGYSLSITVHHRSARDCGRREKAPTFNSRAKKSMRIL